MVGGAFITTTLLGDDDVARGDGYNINAANAEPAACVRTALQRCEGRRDDEEECSTAVASDDDEAA